MQLCIDTSAGANVAIVENGQALARASESDTRRHAESLAPLIAQCAAAAGLPPNLADAPWDWVAVGTGPAPFTGLRAGLVTAQTLGLAWEVPVYGMSSLALVARSALDIIPPDSEVIAVTDARRREVYWARYRADGPDAVVALTGPAVSSPAEVELAGEDRREALVVGPGAPLVEAVLEAEVGSGASADSAVLARLVAAELAAGREETLSTEPLYLRRPDVAGRPSS